MAKKKPSPKHEAKPTKGETRDDESSSWVSLKTALTFLCLSIACCFGYKGYLETRVNTPFDSPKVVSESGLAVPDRYWGSYRPGAYFGMKAREAYSPLMGLMWYSPKKLVSTGEGIRHWCEQGDNLEHYTWNQHDGITFGVQDIVDGVFNMKTSFVKRPGGRHGGDWTARISVFPQLSAAIGEKINLIFYTALEAQTKGKISPTFTNKITGVAGETEDLGQFTVSFHPVSKPPVKVSFLSVEAKGPHLLKETVMSTLRAVTDRQTGEQHLTLPYSKFNEGAESPNFVATQVEVAIPFEMDIVYESASFIDRPNVLSGNVYSDVLSMRQKVFNDKFEETFGLKSKNYSEVEIEFAMAAFSNLIGGIGYFYGASRVKSEHTTAPVPYWKAPLYTAVPSRSFFPRGFLWDEGFHGLLLASWDLDIELDIMSHWFDLMNIEGWIPREQILGQEALAKVPEEFVTQVNTNANPPTFFLTLRYILKNYADKMTEKGRLGTLERLYPRLVAWFDWFNATQAGPVPGSYRWRGRDANTIRELNPKTLTSGLDDYPRASHPTNEERHLDLRCWITLGAATLADIARMLGRDGYRYADTYTFLSNLDSLDSLHWSETAGRYADFGLHTDDVALKRPPPPPPPSRPIQQEMIRVVLTDPRIRLVDSTFGYNSLFPLFIHAFPSNSNKLLKILTDLRNPDLLWTNYGLRSLAKKSPLFYKRNTEHDPPYWRGPIWVNLNYLTLEALHHYSQVTGPYQGQALQLYTELRKNLISNILNQYQRTGYIWEQYSGSTGAGKGSHPFTGWSSLVVLIMAEKY